MALNFSLTSNSYDGRYLKLTCSQSKNVATNTSTISWTLSVAGGNSLYYSTGPTTVTINGTQVYYSARKDWSSKAFPAAKGSVSGTTTVSHSDDGSKTITVKFSTAIYTSTVTTYGSNNNWALDNIDRQATIISAPDFNDESNPVITYSNPNGNNVSSLQACISLTGDSADVAYRDISKTGTSYTFNLTTTERNTLRNGTSGVSRGVKFVIRTVIGGQTLYHSVTKNFQIINCTPSFSPTIQDSNATTVALTGNNQTFISGYSNAQYSIGATVQKSTITSQSIRCGSKSSNTATGTINGVTSGTFELNALSSRSVSNTVYVTRTFISYFKPTCVLSASTITGTGSCTLTISGKCFKGSFGAQNNTITLQYRYKTNNGSYGSWTTTTTPTIDSSNNYSLSVSVTGLNYQNQYTFQAQVIDKLATIESAAVTKRSTPIFDWGKDDFKVNGILNVTGKTNANGGIGTTSLTTSSTITSTGKITANGGIQASSINVNGSISINNRAISDLYSEIYYLPGTSQGLSWNGAGFITDSGKKLYFSIPLRKSTSKISSITINSLKLVLRQNSNYIYGSGSDMSEFKTGSNTVAATFDECGLHIVATKSTAFSNVINNESTGLQAYVNVTYNS